jgi:predicted RNase H-like HicB family nuclease
MDEIGRDMTRYLAVIEEDTEQGVFFASFPDAPGCVADGKTQDEALDSASDVLSEWVADERADGRSAPEPRSYAQLLEAGDLQPGAAVAWVPLLLDTGRLVRANISLDAGLLASIDEAATRRGVTRSAFLVSAAREKIRSGA